MRNRILLALLVSTLSLSANAYTIQYVPNTGNPLYQFNILSPGEEVKIEDEVEISKFEIPQEYIDPILLSAQNWGEKIGLSSPPIKPAIYAYMSENEYNAGAMSSYVSVMENPYKITRTNAVLHNFTITSPESELKKSDTDGAVMVGLGTSKEAPGWQPYTGKHPLYHNQLPDLYAVMTHEIMHSLGVSSAAHQYFKVDGDPTSDQSYYFTKEVTDALSIYDSYLRIYKGSTNPLSDPSQEFMPKPKQKIGSDSGEYDIDNYAPYFIGENAIKVVGNSDNYTTARQNIINNGGLVNYSDAYYDSEDPETDNYPKVFGIPIHPNDGTKNNKDYDLSHIEFRNSYMSHQDFRNWIFPMEAELAFMNDLGYNVPLRKYFGKSYYLNNITDTYTNGFSEWDTSANTYTGAPSTVDQAIGIHIYGNNNNITQAVNNIETLGEGSIGVRIDGEKNTYTLASGNIHANGKENLGIAVTWGNNHEINVKTGTEITATGEDGIAASFDFGSNLFGTADSDIKGSYINYIDDEDTAPDPINQGALVSEFNVEGNLTGSKSAIYISDNAYVKDINIKDGAEINGDIKSEWNSITSLEKASVLINDGGNWRATDPDNPSEMYHTSLNFNAANGVDVNGNITGENTYYNTLKMNNASGSTINFNGNKINVNSFDNKGEINIKNNAAIDVFDSKITGNGDINVLSGASLALAPYIVQIDNTLNFNNASFNLENNSIDFSLLSKMTLSGTNAIAVDVNAKSQLSDIIIFSNPNDLTVNSGAGLQISNVNLLNFDENITDKDYYFPFVSSKFNNQNLLGSVTLTDKRDILTPIYKYNFGYIEDATQGNISLSRGETKDYESYNPAVVAAPVAAQFGGYLSQLNSYDQAFQNLDMKMLMTREERKTLKMANLYASLDTPKVFSPTYLPEEDAGAWFKPYTSFEKADLRNGPKVKNTSYGSYFGGDSPVYELGNDWDFQFSVYAGYNGSHQKYSGNSIYQNGGNLGATGIWYNNDFFTALTANVGASVADETTMYGSADFPMLMTGIASKTGYNWELGRGKFIIQPSYLMSYTFVNTFDYTNGAGVRINSDPLHAINITPGLKFIGNLPKGWQPYIGMQMVWNIMDKTDFKANDIALPDMSVKPYFQYGVGIQKRWGERFTGFFQAMVRNGGRDGVSLSAGFRWALGK